jgi:hypothetical protein
LSDNSVVKGASFGVYANARQYWAFTAAWKTLGLEVGAGNSRLQLPDAYAMLNRAFKMEIPAKFDPAVTKHSACGSA